MGTLAYASHNRAEKSQSGRLIRQMGYTAFATADKTVSVTTNLRRLVYVGITPKDSKLHRVTGAVYVPTVAVSNNAVSFMRLTCGTGASALSFWYELTGYL